ncbi:MAG: hypothetical protein L0Z62_47045 [Gemmataceae bacterium]|nr:hypothetical protein [Gemmataceae bacterium]
MSRRRKTTLPRLAVMAWNQAELRRFIDSTEVASRVALDLGRLVMDLECTLGTVRQLLETFGQLAEQLQAAAVPKARRRSANGPAEPGPVPQGT